MPRYFFAIASMCASVMPTTFPRTWRYRVVRDHPVWYTAFDATLAYWRRDYADWLVNGPSRVALFYRLDTFPISQGLVDWTVEMMRATSSLQVQLACGAVLMETDLRSELARMEIPTLVIHGDADASMPVTFGRATAKLVPGARYVEYAGAPHGLFLTHREKLLADLRDWIAAR